MKLHINNIAYLRAFCDYAPIDKAVKFYAHYLLDRFEEFAKFNDSNGIEQPQIDERTALNGASDWVQWSYGGCGLVYDARISDVIGKKAIHETWLDAEARTVAKAWGFIASLL